MNRTIEQTYRWRAGEKVCLDIREMYKREDLRLISILEDKLYEFLAQGSLL